MQRPSLETSGARRLLRALERRFEDKVEKLQRGDELPPGVIQLVASHR